MAMGKAKMAKKKKMMRGGGMGMKKMRGGGMAKMAKKKKMMRGGMAKPSKLQRLFLISVKFVQKSLEEYILYLQIFLSN
mgnify:CR=1 FL=1